MRPFYFSHYQAFLFPTPARRQYAPSCRVLPYFLPTIVLYTIFLQKGNLPFSHTCLLSNSTPSTEGRKATLLRVERLYFHTKPVESGDIAVLFPCLYKRFLQWHIVVRIVRNCIPGMSVRYPTAQKLRLHRLIILKSHMS